MDPLTDLFIRLCRIDSPSRNERAVQDFILEELRRMGLRPFEDAAASTTGGNAGNVVVQVPGTIADSPAVLLTAHVDTVEPNDGVQIIVQDGVIRTDGTTILGADDKAGVAPLLYVLERMTRGEIEHGTVWAAFTVCEEVGLLGAKALDIGRMNVQMGFVLDAGPPVGSFIVQAPWLTELHVEVVGKAAHAGVAPEEGISAIQVAAEAIASMRLGRVDGETTANVGVLRGGNATNVVCDSVEMRAEARSLHEERLREQVGHMRECLVRAASARGAMVTCRERPSFAGYVRSPGEKVVDTAVAAARSLGLSGRLRRGGGGSDANVLNDRGLPSIVVCTGMQKNHTHEEFCMLEDLRITAELTLEIIRRVGIG